MPAATVKAADISSLRSRSSSPKLRTSCLASWSGVRIQRIHGTEPEFSDHVQRKHIVATVTRRPVSSEIRLDGATWFPQFLPGEILFVPAGQLWSSRRDGECECFAVEFEDRWLGNTATERGARCASLRPAVADADPLSAQMVLALAQEAGARFPSGLPSAEALAMALAVRIASRYAAAVARASARRGGLAPAVLRGAVDFIEAHLDDCELTVAALAQFSDISLFHFVRSFRESMGLPPHKYILHRRVERAKVLLSRTAHSVTEIAMQVGFSTSSGFAAAFRRLTGATPAAYRAGMVAPVVRRIRAL